MTIVTHPTNLILLLRQAASSASTGADSTATSPLWLLSTLVLVPLSLAALCLCHRPHYRRHRRRPYRHFTSSHIRHRSPNFPTKIAKSNCHPPPILNTGKLPSDCTTDVCSICLSPLADIPVAAGPCAHWQHAECLQKWITKDPKQACPLCRLPV